MKTKKYRVDVVRIGYGFQTLIVDAKSAKEAKEMALDTAGDYLFSEVSSDYKVNDVEEIV